MTRRSPTHMRPVVDAAPRIDIVQPDTPALKGGWVHDLVGECDAADTGGDVLVRSFSASGALSCHGQVFRAPRRCDREVAVWRSVRPGRDDRGGHLREWPDLTHGPCPRHQSWRVGRDSAHAGVRFPYTRAAGARERDPCSWSAASSRSVLEQVGAVRGIGRTCENVPDSIRLGAGDLSRHLGSDGDAWHGCRAGAPGTGGFR
jgi:hypothetical protein